MSRSPHPPSSTRGELRRGRSDRHAVRPRHGTASRRWRGARARARAVCRRAGAVRGRRGGGARAPRAELATLERFDAVRATQAFGTDVARMAHAAYAAELVGKLCAPRQVEAGVFDWLVAFLRLLDTDGASAERLRVFEIGLLSGSGIRPGARHVRGVGGGSAGRAGSDIGFRWDPDRGGAVCVAARAAAGRCQRRVRAALIRLSARRWRTRRRAAAGRHQPRLSRGADGDHQPSRERSAQERRIHCQGRAGRRTTVTVVNRPPMLGIRHVALYVADLRGAERFWVDVMGYAVEWRPDPDNVYLVRRARQPGASPARRGGRQPECRPPGPHRHRGRRARRRRRLGGPPGARTAFRSRRRRARTATGRGRSTSAPRRICSSRSSTTRR